MKIISRSRVLIIALLPSVLTGCVSSTFQLDLMPMPALYGTAELNPFDENDPFASSSYDGVLYATDREPAETNPEATGEARVSYGNTSGFALRLGQARVRLGSADTTWRDVRIVSLDPRREQRYPVRLADTQELGILPASVTPLVAEAFDGAPDASEAIIEALRARFERSSARDVNIYVPGARSPFDSSVLVASEMWHYLGYHGAMLAYAWPAQPKGIGKSYFGDAEATQASSRNFRLLLKFLAAQSDIERINVVTYSAGGRIVLEALNQLALEGIGQERSKLANIILTGSDVAQTTFGGYLANGVLDTAERLTIYASSQDRTLGIAEFVFGRDRLGTLSKSGRLDRYAENYLRLEHRLDVVNVTEVSADVTHGHSYFRNSVIVSSDIIALLLHDLSPTDRGLARVGDNPVWTFPDGYISDLRSRVLAVRR